MVKWLFYLMFDEVQKACIYLTFQGALLCFSIRQVYDTLVQFSIIFPTSTDWSGTDLLWFFIAAPSMGLICSLELPNGLYIWTRNNTI